MLIPLHPKPQPTFDVKMILPPEAQESILTLSSLSSKSSLTHSRSSSDSESNSSTRSLLKLENPLPPLPLPPRYSCLDHLPKSRITYDFIPQTSPANSMIMRSLNGLDLYPSYYISLNMNCFVSFSCVTTIRRDGWDGEIVGDFELDVHGARKLGTVSLNGYEYIMDDVFGVTPKMFRAGSYHWRGKARFGENTTTVNLCWEEITTEASSASILTCCLEKEKKERKEIAQFTVPHALRRPGRNKELARLDISPDGHNCLEDIIISLLIVERLRKTYPS